MAGVGVVAAGRGVDSTWLEWFKSGGAFGQLALLGVAVLVGWLQESIQKFSDSEEALKVANFGNLQLAAEHEALSDIGRLVGSSLELGDIYPEFAKHVGELISFDWIAIHIIDSQSQTLELSYVSGFGIEDFETLKDISADKTFASDVIRSSGLIVNEQEDLEIQHRFPNLQVTLGDISDSIERRRFKEEDGTKSEVSWNRPVDWIRSLLGVPLSEGENNFGALVLFSSAVHAYGDRDLEMANRVARQISGAISNSRLFAEKTRAEEMQVRKAEQLETRFKISRILARRDTVESKAKNVLGIVVPQVEAATAVIRIFDADSDALKLVANDGLDSRGLTTLLRLSDKGMSQRVFMSGKSALATHYANEPGARVNLLAKGIRSMYSIPLQGANGPVGIFNITGKSHDHFNQERRDLLDAIADEMASQFDSELLSVDLESSQKEIAVVDEIARIMTSTLDLEQVYEQFFDELKTIVHFDLANVVLMNEESGMMDMAFVSDPDRSSYQRGDSIELAGTIFNRVMEDRRAVIIDDLSQPNDYRPFKKNDRNVILSLIQTPLISEERVIGGFNLFSRKTNSFGQRERIIVERLASQIAPAVQNSLDYRREEQLATALDSIGEAVAFLDSNMVYRHVNRAFVDLYGYAEEEILGQPVEILPVKFPGTEAQAHEIMERGFTSGWSGEVVRRAKSGELLDILLTVAPVKDRDGQGIGRVSVSRDITERKRTEARLNETSRIAAVGELAAGVAHEINNPLTSILLCTEFLADSNLPDEARADLKTISDSAQRAAKIVQNLLLFARRKDTEQVVLRMTSVLERALELKSYDFKIRSIKVRLTVEHDVPCSLIDDHQMTQVIVNVLNNAEQALAAFKNGGKIWIKVSVESGHVLTAISDDGPGIPADVLTKIFEPFFTTKAIGIGTGLGLSICHGIVQQHGGEMWAESTPEQKTTFYIRIPTVDEYVAVPPTDEQPSSGFGEIGRLLIVDDESSIREMISKGLRKECHLIDVAESGEEALEKVRAEEYDCILLDLRLSGIGGPEVYRQIADRDQETANKIIFMTGDTASPETRTFLAGVKNVAISKPFSLKHLREGISSNT